MGPPSVGAQAIRVLELTGPDGTTRSVAVEDDRGFAAFELSQLSPLHWVVEGDGRSFTVHHGDQTVLQFTVGRPFFSWNGTWRQLVDSPYQRGGETFVPLQLLTDFFPVRLPRAYAYHGASQGRLSLEVLDPSHWSDSPGDPDGGEQSGVGRAGREMEPRVVIVDAGHGGRDLGAIGPGGTREKDVALALALALARELRKDSTLEVHLTRDSDVLIPLWQRGEWATQRKGDRFGLFISLHANSLPNQRASRGFETYFLSEARTEHEMRVAANENAPLSIEGPDGSAEADEDLSFILKELRNLDHQHWSALLAELIHERVDPVHPGPDRGVKQGPFAVITNALMPAVLMEVGFISNRTEERLLVRSDFHEEIAQALAEAIQDFFGRYPPGQGGRSGGSTSGDRFVEGR